MISTLGLDLHNPYLYLLLVLQEKLLKILQWKILFQSELQQ